MGLGRPGAVHEAFNDISSDREFEADRVDGHCNECDACSEADSSSRKHPVPRASGVGSGIEIVHEQAFGCDAVFFEHVDFDDALSFAALPARSNSTKSETATSVVFLGLLISARATANSDSNPGARGIGINPPTPPKAQNRGFAFSSVSAGWTSAGLMTQADKNKSAATSNAPRKPIRCI
jgi:hypothetical protein